MNPWIDLEPWRGRSKDLLREAEQRRMVRELREARRAKMIEVRWSLPGDEPKIAALLELNSRPRWEASEERFIVAEEKGKILAALPYETTSKRLWVGLLIANPWAEERSVARALYAGLGDLAREKGVGGVLAQSVSYADYPYEAGFLQCGPWWWLDTTWPAHGSGLPGGGWHRVVALLCRVFRR